MRYAWSCLQSTFKSQLCPHLMAETRCTSLRLAWAPLALQCFRKTSM